MNSELKLHQALFYMNNGSNDRFSIFQLIVLVLWPTPLRISVSLTNLISISYIHKLFPQIKVVIDALQPTSPPPNNGQS